MRRIRKAVVPAAGLGTRFFPVTKLIPKELLPIGTKPAIQYIVEEAMEAGVEEFVLVCRREKVSILDYFRKIESPARFQVVYQEEPLGLGHAVGCAREAVGEESFLVLLPDVLIDHEVPASRQLIQACSGEDGRWGLLVEKVPQDKRISSYGVISGEVLREGVYRMKGAVEKPRSGSAPSDMGILGRYLFPAAIFSVIEEVKPGALGEFQLTDAVNQLTQKEPGLAILCQGKLFDVGNPEGLLKAGQHYLSRDRS